jgi:hypothetical protein
MRSQTNTTWNNMPCHHTLKNPFFWIMESWIAFLSQHAVTKLHVGKQINILFLFSDFFNNKVLMSRNDVHVCKLNLYKIH